MEPPPKPAQAGERTNAAIWISIVTGIVIFVRFAVSDPVFNNLLLDIPLYLAVGLSTIAFWFGVFWLSGVAVGRHRIWRDGRVTAIGWGAAAFAMLAAGGAGGAVILALSRLR